MMTQSSLKRDYEICEELGRGKFGAVFKCKSHSTADFFAVKSVDKSDKEWKILRHLSPHPHPHIIQLHNLYEDETHLHLVIDYCPNGDLFDLIITNQIILSESQTRLIFTQLMQAISHCHEYRVVHRDVKPENVLLDAEYSVKLADFGLANVVMDGETMSEVVGSTRYLAPEILLAMEYGEKVDVWSAGVVLYIMLFRCFPFDGDTDAEIFETVLNKNLWLPDPEFCSVSMPAMDLLTRMLCKNPSERLSAEQALTHPWICNQCVCDQDST